MKRTLLAVLALAAPLLAQAADPAGSGAASSKSFFLLASETGSSASMSSLRFRLHCGTGSGIVLAHAQSRTLALEGGMPASFGATHRGRPWLTAVRPYLTEYRGGTTHTVSGTELDLVPATGISVAGRKATKLGGTKTSLQIRVPALPYPGPLALAVTGPGGSSSLPNALAARPVIDLPRPALSKRPITLRYRGHQGDSVAWALALGRSPVPFRLPGFSYELWLDLATLAVLDPFVVTDPSGELLLTTPPVKLDVHVFVQAFALSRAPGYGPVAFTNIIRI